MATLVAIGISVIAVTMLRRVRSGLGQEAEAVRSSELFERVAAVD